MFLFSSKRNKLIKLTNYFPFEEFYDSLNKISLNLKNITFYNVNLTSKEIIGFINIEKVNNYIITGKNINLINTILYFNLNHYITKLMYKCSQLKIVFQIKICLLILYYIYFDNSYELIHFIKKYILFN